MNRVKKHQCSAEYLYVTGKECSDARKELDLIIPTLISAKGTMQFHNVSSWSQGTVRTQITSCYCATCIAGEFHNDFFESTLIKRSSKQVTVEICAYEQAHDDIHDLDTLKELPVANNVNNDREIADKVGYQEHDWAAVIYENEWHKDQIIQVDTADQDCLVSFFRHYLHLSVIVS